MGEALLPNSKFGAQFSKGRRNLASAAEEVREMVATSGRDVVVIVDEKILKLKESGKGKGEGGGKAGEVAERTAEVLKAVGYVHLFSFLTYFLSRLLSLAGKTSS